jgi:hypothetical protein
MIVDIKLERSKSHAVMSCCGHSRIKEKPILISKKNLIVMSTIVDLCYYNSVLLMFHHVKVI